LKETWKENYLFGQDWDTDHSSTDIFLLSYLPPKQARALDDHYIYGVDITFDCDPDHDHNNESLLFILKFDDGDLSNCLFYVHVAVASLTTSLSSCRVERDQDCEPDLVHSISSYYPSSLLTSVFSSVSGLDTSSEPSWLPSDAYVLDTIGPSFNPSNVSNTILRLFSQRLVFREIKSSFICVSSLAISITLKLLISYSLEELPSLKPSSSSNSSSLPSFTIPTVTNSISGPHSTDSSAPNSALNSSYPPFSNNSSTISSSE